MGFMMGDVRGEGLVSSAETVVIGGATFLSLVIVSDSFEYVLFRGWDKFTLGVSVSRQRVRMYSARHSLSPPAAAEEVDWAETLSARAANANKNFILGIVRKGKLK